MQLKNDRPVGFIVNNINKYLKRKIKKPEERNLRLFLSVIIPMNYRGVSICA